MEEQMYDDTYAVEDRQWWFRNLREILAESIRNSAPRPADLTILDAGCGTGRNLLFYQKYGKAVGVDRSRTGLSYCRKRGVQDLALGDVCGLPFKNDCFDLVNSSDVLYALEPARGLELLAESYRVLKPGGLLFLNTAALDILYSDHDRAVMTRKRYCKAELTELMRRAGFELLTVRYWNSVLFLPVVAYRLGRRMINARSQITRGDLKQQSTPLNEFLYRLMRLDWALAGALPFGTSLFCTAKKPGGTSSGPER